MDQMECSFEVTEASSTSDERQRRLEAYRTFVSTVPRLCSPSMCGMANYKPGPGSASDDQEMVSQQDFEFNWSIDQIALLNPCDFSEDDPNYFNVVEQERQAALEADNDEYFSQETICPSPELNGSSVGKEIDEGTVFEELPRPSSDRKNRENLHTFSLIQAESGFISMSASKSNAMTSSHVNKSTPAKVIMESSAVEGNGPWTPSNDLSFRSRQRQKRLFSDFSDSENQLDTLSTMSMESIEERHFLNNSSEGDRPIRADIGYKPQHWASPFLERHGLCVISPIAKEPPLT